MTFMHEYSSVTLKCTFTKGEVVSVEDVVEAP